MNDDRCVIFFVKLPEKGKVKTRLARDLEWDVVLRLYESMVLDTLGMLKRTAVPFRICYDPPGALDRMKRWLGPDSSYIPQTGTDLGERMEQAFARTFREGADRALLIGSDIPGLGPRVVIDAFDALETHDAVIGPAGDGGYYLIGFQKKKFETAVFRDMLWSRSTVFGETVARLRDRARNVRVLPQCTDVDTKEDLQALLARMDTLEPADSHIRKFLRSERSSILDCCDRNVP